MDNNKKIAQIFREIAEILSILGDNPFRIRAYEKAALNIESLPEDVSILLKEELEVIGYGEARRTCFTANQIE